MNLFPRPELRSVLVYRPSARAVLVSCFALLTGAAAAQDDPDCSPGGLNRSSSLTSGRGTGFTFYSTDAFTGLTAPGPGCPTCSPAPCTPPAPQAYMPPGEIATLLGIAAQSDELYGALGFTPPWTVLGAEVEVYFRASLTNPSLGAVAKGRCLAFRACQNRGRPWLARNNVEHELFHAIQRGHMRKTPTVLQLIADGATEPGSPSRMGLWVSEAQAVLATDRLTIPEDRLDQSQYELWHEALHQARADVGRGGSRVSLTDRDYDAAAFWGYAAEQLGQDASDPTQGFDLVAEFWERAERTDELDGLAILSSIAADRGRASVHALFHDFAIATYTQDLDRSSIEAVVRDPERYYVLDAFEGANDVNGNQVVAPGGSKYKPVRRDCFCVDGTGCPVYDASGANCTDVTLPYYGAFDSGDGVQELAARYLEFNVASVAPSCIPLVLRARACRDVGWAAVGVTPAGGVRFLARGRGETFSHALLADAVSSVQRLTLIVAGLRDDTDFEVWLDRAADAPELTILHPTAESPIFVGPHDQEPLESFLVRIRLDGLPVVDPGGVCPDGGAASPEDGFSGPGLRADDFDALLFGPQNTEDVDVLSATYIGDGEYWLEMRPVAASFPGPHRLFVRLACGSDTTDEVREAVIFGPERVNHMLVLDASASMRGPDETPKIESARLAASFYTNAVGRSGRIGLVVFRGDQDSCRENATEIVVLDDAGEDQRAAVVAALEGVDPAGWTSIGDGVHTGREALGRFFEDHDKHVMLLLSDGEGNEARYLETDFTGDCERPAALPRLEIFDVVASTVAFGADSDQQLLSEVADRTGGIYSFVDPVLSDGGGGSLTGGLSPGNRLADAFLRSLAHARRLDRLYTTRGAVGGGAPEEFAIPLDEVAASPTHGLFFVHCDRVDAGLSAQLFDPRGDPADATVFATSSHAVFHLPEDEELEAGAWRLVATTERDAQCMAGALGRDRALVHATLRVAQASNGGVPGDVRPYAFEPGVPVALLVSLADRDGPVLGARVTARVERPDGSSSRSGCGEITLHDDGGHEDGAADDGVYGALFTDTWQSTDEGGVVNDGRGGGRGERGTYIVVAEARGDNNRRRRFEREVETAFCVTRSGKDGDEDGLPDEWEVHYGGAPGTADAERDDDNDGLGNTGELEAGTDPRDPDSDGGGELDGSEVDHGRCPLDAGDDAIGFPQDVAVVTREGDEGPPRLREGEVLLRYPRRPAWTAMEIWRAGGTPEGFELLATLEGDALAAGEYRDTDVLEGRTYHYRFRASGAGDAVSRYSGVVTARVAGDTSPLRTGLVLQNGYPRVGSLEVRLQVTATPNATGYRISNWPLGPRDVWRRLPEGPVDWRLEPARSYPAERSVFVQVRDGSGRISDAALATVRVDPLGDVDGDRLPNSRDGDDDGDGLDDLLEISQHRTDPLNADSDRDGVADAKEIDNRLSPVAADSDGDGLLDGDEISRHRTDPLSRDSDGDGLDDAAELETGTDPRDPDTDGDGLVDGEDPDPLVRESLPFVRGDANHSGDFDVSDPITVLLHLFARRGDRGCRDAMDANDDGRLDVSDASFLLGFLFRGGRPLPRPWPACGEDTTGDPLGCERFAACP